MMEVCFLCGFRPRGDNDFEVAWMAFWRSLFRFGHRRYERAGFELYGAAVRAARQPDYFSRLNVPDTLDGRFDLVGLHTYLLIRRLTRLTPDGKALAQAVFDAMFADMDVTLRELGVGDLSVGKKVRAMWEAFHGRAKAYATALDGDDLNRLTESLARNVWRGNDAPSAGRLAEIVRAQDRFLLEQSDADLRRGEARFLVAA
jgi:cytochrome b pre-mRNA-processing protein 3